MKARVYIETSVLSYLTALPSRDVVIAGHQQITIEWWAQRDRFSLYCSEAVLAEIAQGDPIAARRRLDASEELDLLAITEEAQDLATRLIDAAAIPAKAAIDAVHVALATVHGVEFLLTWNCTHIANAALRPKIEAVCRSSGYRPPIICTPEELFAGEEEQ